MLKLTLYAAFLMWIKKLILLLSIISVEKAFAEKRRSERRLRTLGHKCVYAKLSETEKNVSFQRYPDTRGRGLASVSQLRRGTKWCVVEWCIGKFAESSAKFNPTLTWHGRSLYLCLVEMCLAR